MRLPRLFPSSALPLFPSSLPFLLSSVLFAACGSPFTETPPVADSTFVSALAELHLAQGRLRSNSERQRRRSDTMRVTLPPGVRDSILARHGTTYRSFRATLSYYVRHPEQYSELYARVVDTLRAEQKALRFGEESPAPPPGERDVPEPFQDQTERD